MERRTFISGISFALLAVPLAAEAQAQARIAFLCVDSCSNLPNTNNAWDRAFLNGLEQAGYVLGPKLFLDMVGVGVGYDRLPEAATRLVRRKADVIVAFGSFAAGTAKRATKTVPIVMVNVADPVEEGLIASLGRPGGNVTGLATPFAQLDAKQLEFLKEVHPRLTRVAVLWNPAIGLHKQRLARLAVAARSLGVEVYPVEAATAQDLKKAFALIAQGRADGLLLFEHLMGVLGSGEISQFALQRRLPTVASDRRFLSAGGLMSYGPSLPGLYERAAVYVGKLLKGVKPSELPVEEPTRYELVVSQVTAKALGLTIPQSVLLRADEVIQ
ncbi:MAG TPA: ABC transporter substrate-binding protein [Methylomirabilota bacterium]|nr:ABC transporter substrate-binding protein [Methylomirabilota bacterium]